MPESAQNNTMSDTEALMWRLEEDPYLSSTFSNITILDRMPDMDRLRRRMEYAVARIPRLRQCVRPSLGNVASPTWADDPEFDLDFHVRQLALPEPGTDRQLLDLATLVTADPFDRTRPLWQFVIVEGLGGGRAALIQKLHHTVTDGQGGVRLALEFLDFGRDAPDPEPINRDPQSEADQPEADSDILDADAVRGLLAGGLRLPLGVVRQVRELLADPSQIPAASSSASDTLTNLVGQLGATGNAQSPLWTERSLGRRLDVASAPVSETRDVARKLGGTLNTAFLTIASEAASRYHVELGKPVEALRASMAISTRVDDSAANAFSLVRVMVPTGDIPIDERFRAIQAAARAAAEEDHASTFETITAIASTLPTSLVTRLARQQAQTVDFATSNVKGSPAPMYVAGALITHNYPVGPLSGVAFNLTLLSYAGSLDMGINTDVAAITDAELLTRCIAESVSELISL